MGRPRKLDKLQQERDKRELRETQVRRLMRQPTTSALAAFKNKGDNGFLLPDTLMRRRIGWIDDKTKRPRRTRVIDLKPIRKGY